MLLDWLLKNKIYYG